MASRPVRVFINGRFLTQPTTGVQRYALELTRALDALLASGEIPPTEYAFAMLAPRGVTVDTGLEHISIRHVGRWQGHLWEQLELPVHARRGILLNLCNVAPAVSGTVMVTIHDASVFATPSAYSLAFRSWYRLLHLVLARTATVVVTDSEYSRSELQRHCRVPPEKIAVVPLGAEHVARVARDDTILARHGLGAKPFVLAVSSLNPNKNFRAVERAMGRLGTLASAVDVVVAGGTNEQIFRTAGRPSGGPLKYIGYVSDGELRALYERAACFVYPSLYEGFGLPPLEAMWCGCPVVVSRTTSLPEVCGDAALYCDPHDPADLASQIERLLRSESLRTELRARGLRRAAAFSWERCGREIFGLLKRAADKEGI